MQTSTPSPISGFLPISDSGFLPILDLGFLPSLISGESPSLISGESRLCAVLFLSLSGQTHEQFEYLKNWPMTSDIAENCEKCVNMVSKCKSDRVGEIMALMMYSLHLLIQLHLSHL